jgi:hypothetical protein
MSLFVRGYRVCHKSKHRRARLPGVKTMAVNRLTAVAVFLNSECTKNDCAQENKHGANGKRIESQGYVQRRASRS